MSGILLPGQDNDPQDENKIELPKGYQKQKKESTPDSEQAAESAEGEAPSQQESSGSAAQEPATPAEQAAQTAQTAQGDAAQQGRRGQGADFAFPPRGAQVNCPSCGTPYQVPIFSIIDLGENPELRSPLLSGQINVAVCPQCGAGGSLGAPLLLHDPENKFLGIYMPMEAGNNDMERQQLIGQMQQQLLRKVPSEQRYAYMLQPLQYWDWQRFMEKLWEFEGVTPEMLQRQRDQSGLLQQLVGMANDDETLNQTLEQNAGLIDRDFFSMLDQLIMMGRQQGQQQELQLLMQLRQKLLEQTEAGHAVQAQQQKVRDLIGKVTSQTTVDELLDLVWEAWQDEDGRQTVGTLAVSGRGLLEYEFLMKISERLGATTDEAEKEQLEALRQYLLQLQEQMQAQQQQSQQSAVQQAQEVLQEVLQAQDPTAKLRENAELLDENFLAFLAANIQQAEQNQATAAAKRLRTIYEQAVQVLQESMPEDLRLLNQLLSTEDEGQMRQLLQENRSLLTQEFVDSLEPIEQEMRDGGRTDLADRIKSLRGQIRLML